MSLKQFITTLCFMLLAVSISAQVPNTINYQGRLSDASGSPVSDGAYLVKFIIYDAATAGTDLWNTGFQTINTIDGLFTYQLGSNVALPSGIFSDTNRYLGLTVGTDPEVTPRSRFMSSAYAFEAGSANNVAWSHISSIPTGFADGVDDEGLSQAAADADYVNVTGDNMTGNLRGLDSNDTLRAQFSGQDGGIYTYGINGLLMSELWAYSYGELMLHDNDGLTTVDLGAGSSGNGFLYLYGSNGSFFNTFNSGNASVQLPNDAISNTEILDEPGIASNHSSSLITFTTTMQDLVTVSITIPTSGYIYVTGRSWVRHNAMTGYNVAALQIDETAGGTFINPYYTLSGPLNGTNNQIIYPFFVDRVYYKTAGTYTFRLEGMGGDTGTDIDAYNHWITAMFTPTSYGSVAASSPLPPTDAEAELVTSTNLDGSTSQVYKYDLRDLELKAKATALKAKEAELELLKAKQQQNANQ